MSYGTRYEMSELSYLGSSLNACFWSVLSSNSAASSRGDNTNSQLGRFTWGSRNAKHTVPRIKHLKLLYHTFMSLKLGFLVRFSYSQHTKCLSASEQERVCVHNHECPPKMVNNWPNAKIRPLSVIPCTLMRQLSSDLLGHACRANI